MKSSRKTNKEEKINALLSRGVAEVIDRGHLEEALRSGKRLRVKLGIDPTGTKIHLGRAVAIRKLKEFQDLGHKVVLVIGGFTAQIGDPSDKLSKRPMLTEAQVRKNMADYKRQLGKILDLRKVEFRNNNDWLRKLNFKEIANLAESFSVLQMLERRNFKDRFERHEEISLREFLYPLMQGYDSVAIKADVELGGTDQLFNLMAGRTIQKYYRQKEQDILINEMLEGTDGRKMSTSWGNVINISDEPGDMYGKMMSLNDELIYKYFWLCTDLKEEEIKKIMDSQNPRDAKARLAFEITALYHGLGAAKAAEDGFNRVFREKEAPENIEVFRAVSSRMNIIDLVVAANMAKSRSEARRLVEQGGVDINEKKHDNPVEEIDIPAEGLILQIGKRKFKKIVV
ncbi:MAG: tyrosine--tRNA ligase [Patescibacteria group bacterium]|nr:tyrosine--tRNA ligase [Patescibacteria group bacterium]MCL5262197.1 tyrosine--tRNA ligase [Patescibacteria group bacterium]